MIITNFIDYIILIIRFLKNIFSIVIFISVVFIPLKSSLSQNLWSRMNSPVSVELRNCFFINNNTGWITGENGTIIKTTNGGNIWEVQSSGISLNIEDVFFIDHLTGWALAWEIFPDSVSFPGTIILKTSDGGNVWTKSMYPDTNNYMKTIFFHDVNNGFIGGVPSSILRTTNSGLNWIPTLIDSNLTFVLPINKIKFINQQTGYACGGFRDIAGVVWATTNSGLTWQGQEIAPEPLFDIDIIYPYKALISGGDLEFGSSIARTENTGANWFYDTLGVFGLATGISARTPGEIWITGSYSQKFMLSEDSGFVWKSLYTPDSTALFDVTFTDSVYGYACGAGGAIFKYDRTSSAISEAGNSNLPDAFRLMQNYPNPFNPSTLINFEIIEQGNVSLIIYDAAGKEIRSLVSEFLYAGSYSETFSADELPSGIYFYKLTLAPERNVSGIISETRKMVLIR